MRVVFSALIAFGIWIGGLTVHEYQLNSLTAEEEYHNLGQNDNITFLYKGMSEEQAKRLTVYLDGFFIQLENCGFCIPEEIILEKYIGGLSCGCRTYCEYNPSKRQLKVVMTSAINK